MSSINTNAAAMTALQALTQTNKMLVQAQNRISTGLRVGEASDNAAYWSIATTMRSDRSALSTVQDALGLGASLVDVTYVAMSKAIEVVDQIKSKLVAAREPGVDKSKIQTEITQLQDQLKGIASAASFSGQNWLSVDSSAAGFSAARTIVSSFQRTSTTITVQTIDIDTSGMDLFDSNAAASNAAAGILDANRTATGTIDNTATTWSIATLTIAALTDSVADVATLNGYIAGADLAIKEMSDAASRLGALKSRIGLQQDFVKSLMDSL